MAKSISTNQDKFTEKSYKLLEKQNESLKKIGESIDKLVISMKELKTSNRQSVDNWGDDLKTTLMNNKKETDESLIEIFRTLDTGYISEKPSKKVRPNEQNAPQVRHA